MDNNLWRQVRSAANLLLRARALINEAMDVPDDELTPEDKQFLEAKINQLFALGAEINNYAVEALSKDLEE